MAIFLQQGNILTTPFSCIQQLFLYTTIEIINNTTTKPLNQGLRPLDPGSLREGLSGQIKNRTLAFSIYVRRVEFNLNVGYVIL